MPNPPSHPALLKQEREAVSCSLHVLFQVQGDARMQDSEKAKLTKATTTELQQTTKDAGMVVLGLGLFIVIINLITSFVYIWYSTTLSADCGLKTYFFVQGILDAVSAVLAAANTFYIKGVAVASSHMLLAEKYKEEHRDAEAAAEQEAFGKEAAQYAAGFFCFSCLMLMVMLFEFGWKIYGIVKAIGAGKADAPDCGNAVTVFWVLFLINLSMLFCNGFKVGQGRVLKNNQAESNSESVGDACARLPTYGSQG